MSINTFSKRTRPEIPFANYDAPVVQAAVDQRRQFFEQKSDRLYRIEIFYFVAIEGVRSKSGLVAAFRQLFHDPSGALNELKT